MSNYINYNHNLIVITLVTIFIFLTRIPFINSGYGEDSDAWRMIRASRITATTCSYNYSRPPGYPISEITYSFIYQYGPLATNGLTALFSAISAALFALILKTYKSKEYILGSIALAFTPIIYINSTNSMDYIWALTFILASVYFTLQQKPILSGLCLGFAVGCRITSGALLPILVILLVEPDLPKKIYTKNILKFIFTALITGIVVFLPVYLTYGIGFFTFYDTPLEYNVINLLGEGVWGNNGMIAIILAIAVMVFYPKKLLLGNTSIPKLHWQHPLAWVISIIIYIIIFLRLPHEAAYLIPIVPFTILIFARYLHRYAFITLCIIIIISCFVRVSRFQIIDGPVIDSYNRRISQIDYVLKVLDAANDLKQEKVVIVSGWLRPQIVELGHSSNYLNNKFLGEGNFIYLLDQKDLDNYWNLGYRIYVVPNQLDYNKKLTDLDLVKEGVKYLF